MHSSVSAWFFPFLVGGATQAQLHYDGASGFIRMIVSRSLGRRDRARFCALKAGVAFASSESASVSE